MWFPIQQERLEREILFCNIHNFSDVATIEFVFLSEMIRQVLRVDARIEDSKHYLNQYSYNTNQEEKNR